MFTSCWVTWRLTLWSTQAFPLVFPPFVGFSCFGKSCFPVWRLLYFQFGACCTFGGALCWRCIMYCGFGLRCLPGLVLAVFLAGLILAIFLAECYVLWVWAMLIAAIFLQPITHGTLKTISPHLLFWGHATICSEAYLPFRCAVNLKSLWREVSLSLPGSLNFG